MSNDSSLWVAIAFFLFFAIAFKPFFRKGRKALREYRVQISRNVKEVQECVQEARVALSRAEDLSALTHQQIREIQQSTDYQIQHAQKELTEALEQLAENQKKTLASHLEFLNTQAKKELRESLLSSALQEVRQTLMHAPLGVQPSFQSALKECAQDLEEKRAGARGGGTQS